MKSATKGLLAILTAASPCAVTASPVVYDFTGNVSSSSGIYSVPSGTEVTGTIVIDYANAGSDSIGTIGSMSETWVPASVGGMEIGTQPLSLSQYLFSDTIQAGPISYATTPSPNGFNDDSFMYAVPTLTYGGDLELNERSSTTAFTSTFSDFEIDAAPGSNPWTSTGALKFDTVETATGVFADIVNSTAVGRVDFLVDSITPVPLPGCGELVLSGLAGLLLLARRRDERGFGARSEMTTVYSEYLKKGVAATPALSFVPVL